MSDEQGVPFPGDEAGPIDDWSEQVYQALKDWQVAQDGNWTRWEPGYVLLTVDRLRDRPIDPIYLYTADEELTVAFADFEIHNPDRYCSWATKSESIAENAKQFVEEWISGDFRTGVFRDKHGKWCGTTMIEPGELGPQLQAAARRMFISESYPVSVEVKTPYAEEWQTFTVPFEWFRPSA